MECSCQGEGRGKQNRVVGKQTGASLLWLDSIKADALSKPLPHRQKNIPGKEMVCLGATGTLPKSQD